MKITAIKRRKDTSERLNVYIDGEFAFSLAEEIATRLAFRSEAEIDDLAIASACAEDETWLARRAALALLSHRQRSEHELRKRLSMKGFASEAVEACIANLAAAKYVDDVDFARAFIRDRLRFRPRGNAFIMAELRSRGVDESVGLRVLREVMEEDAVTEVDLARRAAAKFLPRRNEEPAAGRRRLYGLLARKGFGPDSIQRVIDEWRP